MAKTSKDHKAPVPLFDRLVDMNPETTQEPLPLRAYDRDQLKASIQKELEALLNTRPNTKRLEALEEGAEELAGTTLFYGAHHFSAVDVTSASGKEQIKHALVEAIAYFEPRLKNVSVKILQFEKNTQHLHVLIDGSVQVGDIRENWSFPVVITDVEITKPIEVLAS